MDKYNTKGQRSQYATYFLTTSCESSGPRLAEI